MTKFARIITTAAVLGVVSLTVEGASSWGGPHESFITGGIWEMTYDWGLDLENGPPDMSVIQCGTATCAVGVWQRSGLGNYPPYCDAGGICNSAGLDASKVPYVVVPNGSTWQSAYVAFAARYGTSGSVRENMGTAANIPKLPAATWGALCVGFAYLPRPSKSISVLAPSTTCGLVPPPALTCNIALPDEIDLGTVSTGPVDVHASVVGSYQCSTLATITAALPSPPILAGLTVRMTLGGKDLRTTPVTITTGVGGTFTLSAAAKGTTNVAGVHSVAVPLVLSYY